MNKFRSLIALPLIALVAFGLASCGGDDEAQDLDPAEVLEQTFSGEHEVNSGVIEVSLSGEVPGDEGGNGSLAVTAPFNNNGPDELPDVDLSIDLEGEGGGESIDFSAGGTLSAKGATVNFQDTDYAVPDDAFEELSGDLLEAMSQAGGEGGDAPSLGDFDIDPLSWFTNLANDGTEDIDGTETVHISGDADITGIAQDIFNAVEQAGIPGAAMPEGFDPSQLGLLEGFIEEASFDVFSETETNLLRRLEVTIVLANLGLVAGGGEGSPESASFQLSVTLNEPNEEQEIELPTDTRPIEELEQAVEEEFGGAFDLDALGGGAVDPRDFLPGGGSGKGGSGPGGSGSGGSGQGPGGGEDVPGVDQEYLDCIAEARTPEELAQCAEGL